MKEKYCGVWGNLREEYLKSNKPELYNLLNKTGEIEEYLMGYQVAYSNRADRLAQKLSEERGINDELYKKDALEWILETEKIQEEIQEKLKSEIQH